MRFIKSLAVSFIIMILINLTFTYFGGAFKTKDLVVNNEEFIALLVAEKDSLVKVTENNNYIEAVYEQENIVQTVCTSNPKTDTYIKSISDLGIKVKTDYTGTILLIVLITLLVLTVAIVIFQKVCKAKYGVHLDYDSYREETEQRNAQQQMENYDSGARNSKNSFTKMPNKKVNKQNIKVKFKDVAGIEECKEELREIVDFLKDPQKFISYGIRVPRGILLAGPPGTGKTLLAKATAGEANVPFFSMSGSDFAEMYVGVGAARVRSLFEEARKSKPCIIFIDEIDALCKKRGNNSSSNDEKDATLNALLVEMDGFAQNNGIILMGATNRIDILDPAVLRPGRFDRHVEVGLPDKNGRKQIIKVHAKNKKFAQEVSFEDIARKTTGFSGAELENLLNEAAIMSLRRNEKCISSNSLDDAFSKVTVGLKKKNSSITDKEKKLVAYHETGHALATRLLANKVVEKITIIPTNRALGYILKGDEDEQFLYTKTELFNNICIALAGRVAEQIFFGADNITTGASNDFMQATKTAQSMVFSYGMSSLGVISLSKDVEENCFILSDEIKNNAFAEVQNILAEAEKVTKDFLLENEDKIKKIVQILLKEETILKEDFEKIVDELVVEPATA